MDCSQIKPRWTTSVYLVSCGRTQELGLSLLGRVPMPASYPHRDTSLVYSYYHNIHIYSYVSTLAFYGGVVVWFSSSVVLATLGNFLIMSRIIRH